MPDEVLLFEGFLGAAIARLRSKRAQAVCAERAGVSVATWSRWENGRTPHQRHLAKLLKGLACEQQKLEMAVWQVMTAKRNEIAHRI